MTVTSPTSKIVACTFCLRWRRLKPKGASNSAWCYMKRGLLLASLLTVDAAIYAVFIAGCGGAQAGSPPPPGPSPLAVFGYNDLGMHCMNQDFSELCVLPPANTLRAQVIDRTQEDPRIVTSGVQLLYSIPGNTTSINKTNFWTNAPALFNAQLPPNIGLFGFGLSGTMTLTADSDYWAHGIPITQMTDGGISDPYQLSMIKVLRNGKTVTSTQAVVPVSWEMSCNECHTTNGISVATDILRKHDLLHGTTLEQRKPVLCAGCHADTALGTTGAPGMPTLSSAMHSAHSSRMGQRTDEAACYSCHPGPQTQCLRDTHKSAGLTCVSCHSTMVAVGNPNRQPWQDEPRCGTCHRVAGHEYEQTGKLYRDSIGHNGVKCISCHGSPHAIGPSTNPRDNVQAIALQGHAGPINKCTVCHRTTPNERFNHTRGD
jgi:hypothetical protein